MYKGQEMGHNNYIRNMHLILHDFLHAANN